ncbi:MAG: hypothetical protein AB8G99_05925 [Planctomycetaceae bacterium]
MADSVVYIADEIKSVRELHADLLTAEARSQPIADWLDQRARRILEAHSARDRAVVFHVSCWHPTLVGRKADVIFAADFSIDDARETIAREYGFADWLEASKQGQSPDAKFENAVDTMLAGDTKQLREILEQHPSLVLERSCFGHRSTLLHYVGSNGVETWRQIVPPNLADLARVILNAGADINATAEMYGGGSTALGLLLSSAHPAAAGVTDEVAEVLRSAGANG